MKEEVITQKKHEGKVNKVRNNYCCKNNGARGLVINLSVSNSTSWRWLS